MELTGSRLPDSVERLLSLRGNDIFGLLFACDTLFGTAIIVELQHLRILHFSITCYSRGALALPAFLLCKY